MFRSSNVSATQWRNIMHSVAVLINSYYFLKWQLLHHVSGKSIFAFWLRLIKITRFLACIFIWPSQTAAGWLTDVSIPREASVRVMWHIFIYCLSLIQPSHRWQKRLSFKTDNRAYCVEMEEHGVWSVEDASGETVKGFPEGIVTNIINQLSTHPFTL